MAEGTSLRLTQRQDYASYLSHNNDSIDALINAMRQQAAQAGERRFRTGPSDSRSARRSHSVMPMPPSTMREAKLLSRATATMRGGRPLVAEAQRGAGGLARQAAALRLGP